MLKAISSAAEEHVLYQIYNAPIREYPYPHFYVENVFPGDFYPLLRENWPGMSALIQLPKTGRVSKGAYPDRYVLPLDPDFRCKGGPHYPHRLFQKIWTMEYKPNSLFAFFKNDFSFHGVDPITDENVERDLLLYDVRVKEPEQGPQR